MTDPLAGQTAEEQAPAATPPAVSESDIEARLTAQFEERMKGFQRMVAEKDSKLQAAERRARDLEMSGMTQDERDAAEWETMQTEVERLRQENLLLSKQNEFPSEVAVLRRLHSAANYDEQLLVLRELAKAAAAVTPQAPAAEPELEVPNVDPNNPASPLAPGTRIDGMEMNESLADRILGSISSLRG